MQVIARVRPESDRCFDLPLPTAPRAFPSLSPRQPFPSRVFLCVLFSCSAAVRAALRRCAFPPNRAARLSDFAWLVCSCRRWVR